MGRLRTLGYGTSSRSWPRPHGGGRVRDGAEGGIPFVPSGVPGDDATGVFKWPRLADPSLPRPSRASTLPCLGSRLKGCQIFLSSSPRRFRWACRKTGGSPAGGRKGRVEGRAGTPGSRFRRAVKRECLHWDWASFQAWLCPEPAPMSMLSPGGSSPSRYTLSIDLPMTWA